MGRLSTEHPCEAGQSTIHSSPGVGTDRWISNADLLRLTTGRASVAQEQGGGGR